MRCLLAVALIAGCTGEEELPPVDIVAGTTMLPSEQSGTGTSPIDMLLNQPVGFEVRIASATVTHESASGCRVTVHTSAMPVAVATGANADIVQTTLLAKLPAWSVKLSLCDSAGVSSASLAAESQGLAVTASCTDVPQEAQVRDANGDPEWTSFAAMACTGTVSDQPNNRVLTARDFTMQFSQAPR